MLLDLLCSKNYLMINTEFIRVFGLKFAVYLAYVMNMMKDNITDDKYFEIDRNVIFDITSLSFEEQVLIEDKLIEINLLARQGDTPSNSINQISLDITSLVNMIANGDEKLLDRVTKLTRLPKTLKTGKMSARQQQAMGLKYAVKAPNQELLTAYQDWIDGVYANPKGFLSKTAIQIFQRTVDEYANSDLDLALKIIEIATVNGYREAKWAINLFKKEYEADWRKTHGSVTPITRKPIEEGEVF